MNMENSPTVTEVHADRVGNALSGDVQLFGLKSSTERRAVEDRQAADWSLKAVDLILGALVFVLPFIMGGREAWGHWFLITAALLLGTAWCVHAIIHGCRYRVSWLEGFFAAGLLIAWIQVQPQSVDLMQRFSPEYERLLPAWSATQGADDSVRWSTLSFTPVETQHALWVFVAYSVIACVLFQRIRQPEDCERLLKWIGIVGVVMTGFALLQWVTSNGRFFWFYEHPFTDPTVHLKGAFTNRNHFAQFLSLTIAPLMWWLFRDLKRFLNGRISSGSSAGMNPSLAQRSSGKKSRRSRRKPRATQQQGFEQALSVPILLLVCCVAIVILAVLLSLSRGGMISAGVVTMISLIGLWRGFRPGGALASVLLFGGMLLFSLLAFSDQEQLQVKLDQLISADADNIDTGGHRRAIWEADAKVIQRFPLLGTGVGSHRDVYTLYMENYADFAQAEMTHAESSFVHAALETGLVGAGCLVVALLVLLMRLLIGAFRSSADANRTCIVVVVAAAVGAMLHAVVDFIWYVPAIVVVSLVLAAVGLRSASRNFGTEDVGQGIWCPRFVWATLGGLCLVAMIQTQPNLMARIQGEGHLHAALRTKLEVPADKTDGFEELSAGEAVSLEEQSISERTAAKARYEADTLVRHQVAMSKFLAQRVSHLNKSLRAWPQQHRVQAMLAEDLLRLFDLLQMESDHPFPLNMLRNAAEGGGFASKQDMQEWLLANCQDRIGLIKLADLMARQSLSACPVQGHAYLSLMETAFLSDPAEDVHQNLIDQAMLVRGHDPKVQFVAGREAVMAGDQATAIRLWESVFHSNQVFRLSILRMVAADLPVEFFLQQFKPNAEELKDLLTVYDDLQREHDSQIVLRALCRAIPAEASDIEDEEERLEELMLAYGAARRLEDLELAVKILTDTSADFPLAFEPRYFLGATLVDLERPEQAMEHLKWCYEQDPGNVWIPRLIARARKQMLAVSDETPRRLTQL